MTKANVFIQGRAFNAITAEIFNRAGKYRVVSSIKDSDICVWTGGEDINPEIYGEKPLSTTYYTDRDKSDLEAVDYAVSTKKFLVGICRGAQLLNCIPNGGKLWQHVDNHESCKHKCFDCITGEWIILNSVHHQMLRVTSKAQILAWAKESTVREAEGIVWTMPLRPEESDYDPEAVWYPDTRSFCFQAHPEFSHPETNKYFFSIMDKLYWNKT